MEVINPIIIAGGKQKPSPNTFCEMRTVIGNHTQKIAIVRYEAVPTVSGPIVHILRPGDYTVENNVVTAELLQQYGIERGSFKRMFLAGNMRLNGTSRYMNFCGVYDKSYHADYIRSYYYVGEACYERSVVITNVEQKYAAVPLTPMYAAFGEAGILTLAQLSTTWHEYTTLNLYYLVLEE